MRLLQILSGSAGSYSVTSGPGHPSGARPTLGNELALSRPSKEAVERSQLPIWTRRGNARLLCAAEMKRSSRTSATVRYTGLSDWNELRTALSNSPLISEFEVKAIAREGALVSFTHAGGNERLVSELRQRGVRLSETASGWVMELSRTGRS